MANFNLNKVILGGRLTAEPELKQTPSGVMVLSFSIAVNRAYRSKADDGQMGQQQADFINCVAWRERAEFIARYFHKGSSICVAGQIQTRTWNDQQGNKRYATEVVADEVSFVEKKTNDMIPGPAGAAANAYSASPKEVEFSEMSADEDLPF